MDAANYEEKLGLEMLPYQAAIKIPKVEEYFFNKNSNSPLICVSAMRDRFSLLSTTFGIMRAESIFQIDLSDVSLWLSTFILFFCFEMMPNLFILDGKYYS